MPEAIDSDTIAENAAGPQSASQDGRSASAHSIPDQILAHTHKKNADAVEGTNAQGGAKSGWRTLRPAQVVLPGAT